MSYIIKVKDTNGNWIGIPALKGVDGITPHIGENGNWFIGGEDTGVAAGGLTELPIASADTLGGVKVGDNLTIDENGVLNAKDIDLTPYAQKSELPTKVSDLTNDSLFITNTVNNLTNYYTKTETYTQEQINNLISAAASLKLEVVSVLPTTDISTSTIYLKGTETTGTNDYEEWIYVNNNWELIGTTAIDLTNYATKEYADNTKIYAQIYDLQHNNAINDYKINITKLAAPYVLRGYANNMQSFISSGIIDCEGLGTALAGTSFVLTCGGRSETISFSDTDSVASEADLSSLLTRKIDAAFGRNVNNIEALPIIVNVSMNVLHIGNPTGIYMPISIAHPSEGTSALDVLLLDDGANNHILLDQTLEAWFDNDYFVTHSDITITINNSSFTFYKNTTVQQVIDSINNDESCDFIVAFDAATLEFTLTAKTIDLNTTCVINTILDNGDTNVLWASMGLDAAVASGAQHAEFYLIDNNGTYYHRLQSQTNEYLLSNRFKIVLCDVTNSKYKPIIPMYNDNKEYDKIQYVTMPIANISMANQIIQYVGETTNDYQQGDFYKCEINPERPIETICDYSTRYFESVTCNINSFKPMVDSNMTTGDSYVVKVNATTVSVTKHTGDLMYQSGNYDSIAWETLNNVLSSIGISVVAKRTGTISSETTIATISILEKAPEYRWVKAVPPTGCTNLVNATNLSVRGVGTTAESDSYQLGNYAAAFGQRTSASGQCSISGGRMSQANGDYSMAFGTYAISSGRNSIALGEMCEATNDSAIAIGDGAEAQANSAIALGYSAKTQINKSCIIGSSYTLTAEKDPMTHFCVANGGPGLKFIGNKGNGTLLIENQEVAIKDNLSMSLEDIDRFLNYYL